MDNYDEIREVREDDEIVFLATKTSKVRNLNGEETKKTEEEVITRIPYDREIGMEIGKMLCKRFSRDPPPKSVSQRMDEVYNR
jgi:hypothetical protein